MPLKKTVERARRAERKGNAPSTQAGEFVREQMNKLDSGRGSARSRKQAVAIGLSEARRAGVDLPAPARGLAKAATRKRAKRDLKKGATARSKRSPQRKD